MKNQIERAEPSREAPDAAPHEPDAFEAVWLDYNKAGLAGGWEKVAFVGGFGRGFKAGRESGHVVLLEALRRQRDWLKGIKGMSFVGAISPIDMLAEAEAAMKQAELT